MPTRPDRSQTGSAVVEFALVLPLVLIVALSLVQVGLLVRDRLLIEAAARAGARVAALEADVAAVRAAALAAAPDLTRRTRVSTSPVRAPRAIRSRSPSATTSSSTCP